jgi:hypothetical protein
VPLYVRANLTSRFPEKRELFMGTISQEVKINDHQTKSLYYDQFVPYAAFILLILIILIGIGVAVYSAEISAFLTEFAASEAGQAIQGIFGFLIALIVIITLPTIISNCLSGKIECHDEEHPPISNINNSNLKFSRSQTSQLIKNMKDDRNSSYLSKIYNSISL